MKRERVLNDSLHSVHFETETLIGLSVCNRNSFVKYDFLLTVVCKSLELWRIWFLNLRFVRFGISTPLSRVYM